MGGGGGGGGSLAPGPQKCTYCILIAFYAVGKMSVINIYFFTMFCFKGKICFATRGHLFKTITTVAR